ncbi:hypothetical protein OH736_45650 (plasmid) [Streptomyces sp. NBC_01650]|uniref:hypothetical protein n=1 Tax=Streptomyces sp. NBC_01650 TaxID=2975907 RepID=UPI002F912658|nr:hypothetical protein OH736_45650 [Streptomyces sp. NBC_01650]
MSACRLWARPGTLSVPANLGEEGVGALVEAVQELVGQSELVAGPGGVGEGEGEGEADLRHGALAYSAVLLGFGAAGFEGGDRLGGVGVGPVDVAEDAVVAALPAQGGGGGQGGGEVAGEAGQVGQTPAGLGGEAAAGVGDLLHPGPGGVVLAEVLVRLGPVVQGHLGQLGGQQAGVQDGGETVGGAPAVFVLAAGDRGEEFGQGVGGCVQCRVRYPAAGACRDGGWGEGFPDGVVGVDEGGVGEPAQVGQAVVAGQAQALAQAGDEEDAAGGEGGGRGPLVAEGGQGAGGGLVPVRRCPAVVGVVVGFGEG